MNNHNKYIFDFQGRKFRGAFEQMYQNEMNEGYDSWSQDSMSLFKKIDLEILSCYNFDTILDIGCGKGHFTHLLKKQNNHVIACDISKTAIDIAKVRYPDIQWECLDINDMVMFERFLSKQKNIDLVVARAVLYYLKNWRKLVNLISKYTVYMLVGLHVPQNTLAFIKTHDGFVNHFKKYFKVLEHIVYKNRDSFTIFAKVKTK